MGCPCFPVWEASKSMRVHGRPTADLGEQLWMGMTSGHGYETSRRGPSTRLRWGNA